MTDPQAQKPHGAGKSSFDLINQSKVFRDLPLRKGMVFLDLGCGPGDYALAAASLLGAEGIVYAVDLWAEALEALRREAKARSIENIKIVTRDMSKPLPIERAAVDVSLMATVLHDLVREGVAFETLEEAARVSKPGAVLGVLEFKKMDGPPGPSIEVRLTSEDVERLVSPHGFVKQTMSDVGPFNYLITFKKGGREHETRS